MATFNVGIGKDDIQEPVLLAEDWYEMEITKEPYESKNKAWTDAGENLSLEEAYQVDEKAGQNIVVNLKINSDIPEAHGRSFTKWLPLPNSFDEGKFMNDGQPRADWKASVIHAWVEAFGSAEGSDVTLNKGAKGLVYVTVEKDRQTEKDINAISMNVNPRSLSDAGGHALDAESTIDESLL